MSNSSARSILPVAKARRRYCFENFVREIKLLHQVSHDNVVRVFNYFLYPAKFSGYILMEFVDGLDIEEYISDSPEQISDIFLQAIDGFAYLEQRGILHRDIRPGNLLVNSGGRLKIIDLGFGKRVQTSLDFGKSITLNWWCQTPKDFDEGRYDFKTEVYFVGKLFEQLIADNAIGRFKYSDVLDQMCLHDPRYRISSFELVGKKIRTEQFDEVGFSDSDRAVYQNFAETLGRQISKFEATATYTSDVEKVVAQLEDIYRRVQLEVFVPDPSAVIRCVVNGTYYYRHTSMTTECLHEFVLLLKSSSPERRKIIIANLHSRLDALPRYDKEITDDDIPF